MYLWKKVSSSPFLKGQSQQGNHWSLPFSPGTDFNWKDLPPFPTRILTSSHIKPVATYWSVFFFFFSCLLFIPGRYQGSHHAKFTCCFFELYSAYSKGVSPYVRPKYKLCGGKARNCPLTAQKDGQMRILRKILKQFVTCNIIESVLCLGSVNKLCKHWVFWWLFKLGFLNRNAKRICTSFSQLKIFHIIFLTIL